MCSKTEILPRLFGILARKAGGKRAGSWWANEKILLGVSTRVSGKLGLKPLKTCPTGYNILNSGKPGVHCKALHSFQVTF
jgi:hypothetical protein